MIEVCFALLRRREFLIELFTASMRINIRGDFSFSPTAPATSFTIPFIGIFEVLLREIEGLEGEGVVDSFALPLPLNVELIFFDGRRTGERVGETGVWDSRYILWLFSAACKIGRGT